MDSNDKSSHTAEDNKIFSSKLEKLFSHVGKAPLSTKSPAEHQGFLQLLKLTLTAAGPRVSQWFEVQDIEKEEDVDLLRNPQTCTKLSESPSSYRMYGPTEDKFSYDLTSFYMSKMLSLTELASLDDLNPALMYAKFVDTRVKLDETTASNLLYELENVSYDRFESHEKYVQRMLYICKNLKSMKMFPQDASFNRHVKNHIQRVPSENFKLQGILLNEISKIRSNGFIKYGNVILSHMRAHCDYKYPTDVIPFTKTKHIRGKSEVKNSTKSLYTIVTNDGRKIQVKGPPVGSKTNVKRKRPKTLCPHCGKKGTHKPEACYHNPARRNKNKKLKFNRTVNPTVSTNNSIEIVKQPSLKITRKFTDNDNSEDAKSSEKEEAGIQWVKNFAKELMKSYKGDAELSETKDSAITDGQTYDYGNSDDELFNGDILENHMMTTTVCPNEKVQSTQVCLDSGASDHFFCNKAFFVSMRQVPEVKVSTAKSGQTYSCSQKGKVLLKVKVPEGYQYIYLKEVYYSPQIPRNYISLSLLDDDGYKIILENKNTVVYDKDKNVVMIASKHAKHRIYLLNHADETCYYSCNAITSIHDMHRRYGHISYPVLKQTIPHVHGVKLQPSSRRSYCPTCDLTKTSRPAVRKSGTKPCKQRLHCDVKSLPSTRSVRGYKHYVICVHEGSRCVIAKPLKRKSHAEEAVKKLISHFAKESGAPIKEFRSDAGGEFTSTAFRTHLEENNISFVPSGPRTPEQNGVAERHIRSVQTIARSMLMQAKLSNRFWCFAIENAANVLNHVVRTGNNVTPIEALTKRRPDVSNIITLGCLGVLHIPKEDRKSIGLSPTAQYVRMLSPGNRHNTYHVMTQTGKILRDRRVKWYTNEFKFPGDEQITEPESLSFDRYSSYEPEMHASSSEDDIDASERESKRVTRKRGRPKGSKNIRINNNNPRRSLSTRANRHISP